MVAAGDRGCQCEAAAGVAEAYDGSALLAMDAPVGVSVVMPGMIRTGMNPLGSIGAEQVATNVVDAIRRGRSYVFTDDHHIPEVESRLNAIMAARADVVS